MEWIDTHAHLYAKAFNADRDKMIGRAVEAGVGQFFLPNIDRSSVAGMLALEEAYPERCFAMMGLHPCSVEEGYEEELAYVREWLDKRSFCAIGEIGIDLYWDKSTLPLQRQAFLTQVAWALELDIPFVIHSRESTAVLIELLQDISDERMRGIFHCFTGTRQEAEQIIEMGFLLGIGGVLTFKNAGLDKTVADLDLDHLVLETDAPYLAPIPFRGKRNESAYVPYIGQKLAEIKGISAEEVARRTTDNARRMFEPGEFSRDRVENQADTL